MIRSATSFALIGTRGATFRRPAAGEQPDPQFAQWLKGRGPYATNGILVCITKRSRPERREPDLFMICVPGIFAGYKPGYTQDIARNKSHYTWLILKAHTNNRAGTVTFKNARALRDALSVTPLDRVLVETDAPYLTPAPWRGATNSPYLVPLTVRAMAGVLGVAVPTLCQALSDNSEAVYGPW